mgnify:CR=1 FL=1
MRLLHRKPGVVSVFRLLRHADHGRCVAKCFEDPRRLAYEHAVHLHARSIAPQGVVGVLGRDDDTLYLEDCARGDLIESPPTRVAAALRGPAESLAALHADGMAHGDVKPDNLFVRRDGDVVLGDFGASLVPGRAYPHRACSSPSYRPPEHRRPTPAIDVYSLGRTIVVLRTRSMKTTPEHVRHRDPVLYDLLTQMLRRDPRDRLSMPDVLRHEWFTV